MNAVDLLEENNRQRYLVRREAARKRGASLGVHAPSPRVPVTTELAGSALARHLPTPAALAVIVVALMAAALLGLAFLGALTLVRGVFDG